MVENIELGPTKFKSRIESMDILRGIAVLGILYMNIPLMATNIGEWMGDPRRLSWGPLDQFAYQFIAICMKGTQRGMFELLFGAGILILTARAMRPDGPVAVADLYYRRNLWLVAFGIIDIYVIGWAGDILFYYGLAALFLFPLRTLSPRLLLPCGLAFSLLCTIGWPTPGGIISYRERVDLVETTAKLETKSENGAKLTKEDKKKLDTWHKRERMLDLSKPAEGKQKEIITLTRKAHTGSPLDLLGFSWTLWSEFLGTMPDVAYTIAEACGTMLIGMALFKLGVIQGERSVAFYAALALGGYLLGCGLRIWHVSELLRFDLAPRPSAIFNEPSRLLVTLGHLGFINLLLKLPATRAALGVFRAPGRMAFSIYVGTSLVAIWLVFAPWGLDLWGRLGWFDLLLAASAINLGMLIAANVWLRYFACGPLEWGWRALAYAKKPPFRQTSAGAPSAPVPGAQPARG